MPSKDNIDKNAIANLVQSHFHGTGISLFELLDHENQRKSLDCDDFMDAVYSITRYVSDLSLSKILVIYFHYFEINSIHLTCSFIQ